MTYIQGQICQNFRNVVFEEVLRTVFFGSREIQDNFTEQLCLEWKSEDAIPLYAYAYVACLVSVSSFLAGCHLMILWSRFFMA